MLLVVGFFLNNCFNGANDPVTVFVFIGGILNRNKFIPIKNTILTGNRKRQNKNNIYN